MQSKSTITKDNITIQVLFCGKPEQTVECVQSFEGFNISLLSNGGFSDRDLKVFKAYPGWENIRIYGYSENIGVARGRNELIKANTSEWLFFVDNDITIATPDWMDVLNRAIARNPGKLIFLPKIHNVHLAKDEKPYAFSVQENKAATYVTKEKITNKISGGACIINRKVFEEHGLYDEHFFVGFEDFEYSLRAILQGRALEAVLVPGIVLNHDHRQSTTSEDDKYLAVRYSAEKIRRSYELIKEIHGLELPDDGVEWSQRQIESMKSSKSISDLVLDGRKLVGLPIRVLVCTDYLHALGGIETGIYNFIKRMSPYYDVTFLCKGGDGDSLVRIARYAKVIIHTNQTIETDVCIFQTAWGDVPDDKIIAKQYIQMVHGDYEWMRKALNFKYKPRKPGIKHIAVGEFVSNQFKKETKFDAPIIYNLLDTDAHAEQVLRLISVTRIGREKGMERIDKMARMLKAAGKKFIWLVYGSGQDKAYEKKIRTMIGDIQEVVFMGSSTDTASMVADSDYLVALSDSEGFSYSIYEALQLGTPCIITDFPSGHEQIEDGVNGYIVKKDLSDLDVNKICQHIPKGFKFEERASEQDWIKVLGGTGKKLTKAQRPNNVVKVKARIGYRDISLNRSVKKDEVLELPEFRAFQLLTMNIVKFI